MEKNFDTSILSSPKTNTQYFSSNEGENLNNEVFNSTQNSDIGEESNENYNFHLESNSTNQENNYVNNNNREQILEDQNVSQKSDKKESFDNSQSKEREWYLINSITKNGITVECKRWIYSLPKLLRYNPSNIERRIFLWGKVYIKGISNKESIMSLNHGLTAYHSGKVIISDVYLLCNRINVSQSSKLIFKNCILEYNGPENSSDKILIEGLEAGKILIESSEIRNGFIFCRNRATLKCNNSVFVNDTRTQDFNLLLLNNAEASCSFCNFINEDLTAISIYVSNNCNLCLENCNLNFDKGPALTIIAAQSKANLKNCNFSDIRVLNGSKLSVLECNGLSLTSLNSKLKIVDSNFLHNQRFSNLSCRGSIVKCSNSSFGNCPGKFTINVRHSYFKGVNMKIIAQKFNFIAFEGSNVFLVHPRFNNLAKTVGYNSKVSHTGEVTLALLGNFGIENILGTDQLKEEVNCNFNSRILNNINYSSNGIDGYKNQIILDELNDCFVISSSSLSDSTEENHNSLELLNPLSGRKYLVDRFGYCFTKAVFLDDINPKLFDMVRDLKTSKQWSNKKLLSVISVDLGEHCPICLEDQGLDSIILPCGHKAHKSCLRQAEEKLGYLNKCPVCFSTVFQWIQVFSSESKK